VIRFYGAMPFLIVGIAILIGVAIFTGNSVQSKNPFVDYDELLPGNPLPQQIRCESVYSGSAYELFDNFYCSVDTENERLFRISISGYGGEIRWTSFGTDLEYGDLANWYGIAHRFAIYGSFRYYFWENGMRAYGRSVNPIDTMHNPISYVYWVSID